MEMQFINTKNLEGIDFRNKIRSTLRLIEYLKLQLTIFNTIGLKWVYEWRMDVAH
jgi:hypothetical protein